MSQNPHDYSYVLATVGLADLQDAAFQLSNTLDADGTPAQASRVRRAFMKLLAQLEQIAQEIADEAQRNIVDARQQGEVRGSPGMGGHLDDYVGKSRALTAVEGSVGINDEAFLDSSPMYWWRAIDLGYDWSGHQDVDLRGLFYPGAEAPNAAMFRQHPVFQAMGRGPRMTPANDIEPQRFVDRGFAQTEAAWHARVNRVKAEFMRECERALAAAGRPGPRPGKARRRP